MIDSEWFYRQLEKDGRSVRAMARALGLDPSAVSRMLKGERKMSAEEQDGIADYLGVSINEVAHVGAVRWLASRRRGRRGLWWMIAQARRSELLLTSVAVMSR